MKTFVIVDNEIIDKKSYQAYIKAIAPTVEEFEGTYLIRGGTLLFSDSEWNPDRLVVIEFPDNNSAMDWVQSPELAKLHQKRRRYAKSKMIVVEGL